MKVQIDFKNYEEFEKLIGDAGKTAKELDAILKRIGEFEPELDINTNESSSNESGFAFEGIYEEFIVELNARGNSDGVSRETVVYRFENGFGAEVAKLSDRKNYFVESTTTNSYKLMATFGPYTLDRMELIDLLYKIKKM